MEVLIVEDDRTFGAYILDLVDTLGHRVEMAEVGKEALAKARKKTFDLILLDVYLPDTTAHELIPRFKELNPGVMIVTMTGENTEDLERRIRKLGITYYMAKPFAVEEFSKIISHLSKMR
jgi:DNA-binding response OmpR family regulator